MKTKDVYLHNPTNLELDDAYRGLSVLKSIVVKSSNYQKTILELEKIGFVAIEIISNKAGEQNQTIRAFKGKHGPCHFTGEKVGYAGSALAALDDDNHILHSNKLMEVCVKTYRILGLPAYQGLVESKSEFQEIDREKNSNGSKDIEDFESSQAFLYDQLQKFFLRSDQRKTLFYPGPFRMLILKDGSMVYRGKWCSVPLELSQGLIAKDRCNESSDKQNGQLTYFQDEYEKNGSAALLNVFSPKVSSQPIFESDFSKLLYVSNKFKERLLHLIDNHKKYILLIGNEAEDQIGCCPSEEVTEANQLVKYGILSSLAEPLKSESCPVTMYAFKDELSISSNVFDCQINEEFRSRVHKVLKKSQGPVMMKVLKWVLLVFILISLGVAARRCKEIQNSTSNDSIYQQLNLSLNDPFIVILFHNQKRCYQCLQMEKHTSVLLNEHFHNELETERLVFKTVVIDDPGNMEMVDMFGVFAPTLVLMKFDQKELIKSKVLLDVTGLYRDEPAFKDQLEKEIYQFIVEEDE